MTRLGKGSVPLIVENLLKEAGPMRVKSIAQSEGLVEASVRQCLAAMRKRGQVHIHGWHRLFTDADGKPIAGRPAPIYAWGPGEDAMLPSVEERQREQSARFYRRWRSLGGRGYRGKGDGIETLRKVRASIAP